MKKVLFIVRDMRLGGVQKSILSFLQCFVKSEYADQYELHLLVLDPKGDFLGQVPEEIKIVPPARVVRWMTSRMNKSLFQKFWSARGFFGEICWLVRKKLHIFPKNLNTEQQVWFNWHRLVPAHGEDYDVVVSYQDGESNYYAMDKVKAKKKILWLHIDYQKPKYDPSFDRRYYKDCDAVVTVSENCRKCFLEAFPQLAEKTHVLENITSADFVLKRGNEPQEVEYRQSPATRILSIGRLHPQKGFDLAIDAAKLLREAGAEFQWLVVGEGAEREKLQQQIQTNGVADCFKLVGARENPYAYMKACDIIVMSSRYEGKPIALDEAKIFCKPIVSTNYSTVNASLEHGKSGWIVDMNPEAIAKGVMDLCADAQLRNSLQTYLENCPKGNEGELRKYIDIMF